MDLDDLAAPRPPLALDRVRVHFQPDQFVVHVLHRQLAVVAGRALQLALLEAVLRLAAATAHNNAHTVIESLLRRRRRRRQTFRRKWTDTGNAQHSIH